jgi:hypothetical protein
MIRLIIFVLGFSLTGQAFAAEVVEEVVEQTYPIDADGTLSIHNAEGSIQIYGGAANEIKLYATKSAYSTDRLKNISVNVTRQAKAISIETGYPAKPNWGWGDRSGTVDYIITVPQATTIARVELSNGEVLLNGLRGGSVHAFLQNGCMSAENCFSDLHLAVTTGGLDFRYDWWETRKFSLDAEIVHGNARAFMPGEAAFHLAATTADGGIVNDFAEQPDRHREAPKKIDMLVNGGAEAEVKISATNGSIKITEANP